MMTLHGFKTPGRGGIFTKFRPSGSTFAFPRCTFSLRHFAPFPTHPPGACTHVHMYTCTDVHFYFLRRGEQWSLDRAERIYSPSLHLTTRREEHFTLGCPFTSRPSKPHAARVYTCTHVRMYTSVFSAGGKVEIEANIPTRVGAYWCRPPANPGAYWCL